MEPTVSDSGEPTIEPVKRRVPDLIQWPKVEKRPPILSVSYTGYPDRPPTLEWRRDGQPIDGPRTGDRAGVDGDARPRATFPSR